MVKETPPNALVVVPKRDELRALCKVFGLNADNPDERLEGREVWTSAVNGLLLRVLFADTQSGTKLALATSAAIDAFDPDLLVCVGTAAGREARVTYLDVVMATNVLDATEWRTQEGGEMLTQWNDLHHPLPEVLHDIDDCVKSSDWQNLVQSTFRLHGGGELEKVEGAGVAFRVIDGWTATTPFLHQDPALLESLWGINARIRVADMETADFVDACEKGARRRAWFVVRSVSDFGTADSKRDELRFGASLAAAASCHALFESGLKKSHPLRMNSRKSSATHLSEGNYLAKMDMAGFLVDQLPRRFGIVLDKDSLMTDLTVSDLVTLCQKGRSRKATRRALDDLREEYFTTKYLEYRDQSDVRGLTGNAWTDEVNMIFSQLSLDLAEADILYVGVGKGQDVPDLLPKFKTLTGVDISRSMLRKAKEVTPRLSVSRDIAESLSTLRDESFDLYLSLRVFQSSLFDIEEALRQATRVLRPGGSIVLSIPGGFVDLDSKGHLRFLPGLHPPGSDYIDRARPRHVAERIITQMERLLFQRIGHYQDTGDYYIYARRA